MAKPIKGNFKALVRARQDASVAESTSRQVHPGTKGDYTTSMYIDLIESFAKVGLVIKNVKDIAEILVARGWVKTKKLN